MLEIRVSNDLTVPSFATRSIVYVMRGAWATATSYHVFDIVTHNGSSYIAEAVHTSGALTEPGVGANWQTVWAVQAAAGADGEDFQIDGIVLDEATRDADFGEFPVGTIVLVTEPSSPYAGTPHLFRLETPHAVTPVWSIGSPFNGAAAAIASQPEAEGGTENTKTMTSLRTKQQIDARMADSSSAVAGSDPDMLMSPDTSAMLFDARIADLPSEGTEADPAVAFDGLGLRFDLTNRQLVVVAGVKGDVTYPPEDALVVEKVDGGHKIGTAQNFASGLPPFQINTSQGSPKISCEGIIASGADDAIDIGVRRYNGTTAAPRGLDTTDIGHISSRDYDQFAPIWSDGQGTSSPAPWFPPEFQLGTPIMATGTITSGQFFTVRYRQHTSGLAVTPVTDHRYFIAIRDMAQASIPASFGFNFNGTNYAAKRNDGTDFPAGTVPKEGVWTFNGTQFRADVDSGTNAGHGNLAYFYREADGGAVLPFFGRSWSRTVWVPSAPTGTNREGIVTYEVTPRYQHVPRVSMVLAGKGVLIPGGGFYYDKISDDGFYAPDNYPRDGSEDHDADLIGGGGSLLDPVTTDNVKAISPGTDPDSSVNHLRLAPMGALSLLASHSTRFPTLTMTEGPAPDKGVWFSHDTSANKFLIRGVDRGAAVAVETAGIVEDELGNVNLKIIASDMLDQELILVEGNTPKLNGFWTVHPTSRNEFSLHGSHLDASDLAAAQALIGSTTVRRCSPTTLMTIGYSGGAKNDTEFLDDVIFSHRTEWGNFTGSGAIANGKEISSANGYRLDSSRDGSGSQSHQHFYNSAAGTAQLVGSISTNGNNTTYATSSDERKKENFQPIDSGTLIDAMAFYKFQWINDGSYGYGPKAQELYIAFPDAVVVGGDDPDTEPWSYDPGRIVPVVVTEVQALRARVADLEYQVTDLLARVTALEGP